MRVIKDPINFVTVLRALETVVIFAMLGLIVYAIFAGIRTDEIRQHYKESHDNEERILELLEEQQKTQEAVERVEDEVVPK